MVEGTFSWTTTIRCLTGVAVSAVRAAPLASVARQVPASASARQVPAVSIPAVSFKGLPPACPSRSELIMNING